MNKGTFEDYIVVMKAPSYTFSYYNNSYQTTTNAEELTSEARTAIFGEVPPETEDKTFWLVSKDGSYIRRFSIESAPKWVMDIYNKLNLIS